MLKSHYSKVILNNSLLNCLLSLLLVTGLIGCTEISTPKPRGYFRIALPQHQYQNYQTSAPISLDIPTYSKVELNTQQDSETYKFNVYFPSYKARIHCTYVPVKEDLDKLLEDAYQFAYKHESKALAINKSRIDNPSRQVFGMRYDLIGNVASPIQFFATDSTEHFFRGSLYFSHIPNADSLQPVVAFVKEDINHMIQSINWGN